MSRPAWARGLKQIEEGRTDEEIDVAPRMGAWIETDIYFKESLKYALSRPAWARGLKRSIKS